jgi:hypothetical protein
LFEAFIKTTHQTLRRLNALIVRELFFNRKENLRSAWANQGIRDRFAVRGIFTVTGDPRTSI